MKRYLGVIVIAAIVAAASAPGAQAHARTHASPKPRAYWSPDRQMRAIVVAVPPRGYGNAEDRVEIRTRTGRLLAVCDYSEKSGSQGFGVTRATWTPDGRYFVYQLESAGGHSPWHSPSSFYSRRGRRFYSLDKVYGPITGALRVSKPCLVATTHHPDQIPITIDLSKLERTIKPSAIDRGNKDWPKN